MLVSAAAVLLGLLAVGLFVVSLAAQYRYVFDAKHQALPSVIEAVGLDVGMTIFSLLALGLARAGQSARVERALVIACALGSAAMNYAAANDGSPRSVAAYVMPPVFLAVVVDRVVAVVRRHVLGDSDRSAWTGFGRVALYALRFVLAMPSTAKGLRRQVLILTPLPDTSAAALSRPSPHRRGRAARCLRRRAARPYQPPSQKRAGKAAGSRPAGRAAASPRRPGSWPWSGIVTATSPASTRRRSAGSPRTWRPRSVSTRVPPGRLCGRAFSPPGPVRHEGPAVFAPGHVIAFFVLLILARSSSGS